MVNVFVGVVMPLVLGMSVHIVGAAVVGTGAAHGGAACWSTDVTPVHFSGSPGCVGCVGCANLRKCMCRHHEGERNDGNSVDVEEHSDGIEFG
ncbi:uncharacterized protein EV420DRAFT_1532371 [Desarmillaria tabescens]|uniref:Secreted protein n=1 Tax=Armillaria tabescens TaxID=1929756 RepID=A0AA39TN31_ARMTA|nr:uncharacterized protein EV420DRAFT_1532371 [Desarmillaria tabescens]KAK0460483.1 hypothetical protein EV420DRAFT_1532371 [Desarmillaria tabescens]